MPGNGPFASRSNEMLKKIATVLGSLAFIASLSACNTVQGVGKDVQKAGSAVEQAGKK